MSASRLRRILALTATSCIIALTATACAGGSSSSSETDALKVGLGAAPANLDYTQTSGVAIPQALLYNVYETLLRIDDDGSLQPLLATGYTVSDDRLSYTFTLRTGVAFSNGDDLTSSDVAYSLGRVQDGDWAANSPTLLTNILSSIETPDASTVVINLSTPSNEVLYTLAGPLGTVFDEQIDPSTYQTAAIGSGPFTVDHYDVNQSLVLDRNPSYWGDAAGMSTITLSYYSDTSAETNALRTGDLDFAFSLASTESVPEFQDDTRYTVYQGSTTGEVMMAMNNASGPLSDVRVRKAIMYGVDRQKVMDQAVNGYGTLIGSMVPPTDPWYDASLVDLYPYDPDQAKELLAEAGQTDLTLRMRIPNLAYAVAAAQEVKTELADIGVDVEIEELEFPSVWLQEVFQGSHDYDLSIIQHSEPRDIFTIVQPGYYLGIQDDTIKATMDAADQGDADQFVSGMKQAASMLADDAVADWLWLTTAVSIASSDLQDVPYTQASYSLYLAGIHR